MREGTDLKTVYDIIGKVQPGRKTNIMVLDMKTIWGDPMNANQVRANIAHIQRRTGKIFRTKYEKSTGVLTVLRVS